MRNSLHFLIRFMYLVQNYMDCDNKLYMGDSEGSGSEEGHISAVATNGELDIC